MQSHHVLLQQRKSLQREQGHRSMPEALEGVSNLLAVMVMTVQGAEV